MSVKNYPNLEITLDSGIHLNYPPQLDGGGLALRFDFLNILNKHFRKDYKHGYEWCAGFGIIGFELFGNTICENIHFSDIFPLAIETCINTASTNDIANKVFGYVSDNVKDLPVEHLFDLIVGNGPCSFDLKSYTEIRLKNEMRTSTNEFVDWDVDIRLGVDDDCNAHKEFFDNITHKITKDCDILLVINTHRTDMILTAANKNGFEVIQKYPVIVSPMGGEIWHFKLK